MAIVEQRLAAHERQILDLRLGNEHKGRLIVVGKAEGKPIDTRSDPFLLGVISDHAVDDGSRAHWQA